MVNKLKATGSVLLLISMLMGLFFIFFDFTPFWGEGDAYHVILHTHLYGSGNALNVAELYLDTALDYSVYQAVYDSLKGIDSDNLPTNNEFKETVRMRIEDNLKKYSSTGYSFTKDYTVAFPKYTVELEEESGKLKITSSSDNPKMVVTKFIQEYGLNEDIIIKRTKLPQGTYDINYAGMLETVREHKPSISERLQAAFSEASIYLEDYAINALTCSDIESCSQKLTEEFQTKLSREAPRPFESGNYLITPEITEASVSNILMESGEIKRYDLRATQKVTINETELYAKYYPVWNGTDISFESMELVYLTGLTGTTLIEDPA